MEEQFLLLFTQSNQPMPLLSGKAREWSEHGQRLLISRENFKDLLRSAPSTAMEKRRKLLQALAHRSCHMGAVVKFGANRDYPLGYCKNAREFSFLLTSLEREDKLKLTGSTTSTTGVILSAQGWDEAERLPREISTKGFVAMAFAEDMKPYYHNGIEPAIKSLGYGAFRIDQVEHVGKIDDRIMAEIQESRFIVADFTHHRGGVYFEAGYALGLGLPVIWTCRKDHMKDLHFDIRQYNCIDWADADDLSKRLKNRIRAAVGSLNVAQEIDRAL